MVEITWKQHAERRLRNILDAPSGMPLLQSMAWQRCGVGLRPEEFEEVIQELIAKKYLVRDMTKRGKALLRKNVEV
jgi:hypothetical protein